MPNQAKKYHAALQLKQNGTQPRFEEELWQHCCSYYHSDVPNCDLCRPGSDEQIKVIKDEIAQHVREQNEPNRSQKIGSSIFEQCEPNQSDPNPSDVKRRKDAERQAKYRQSLPVDVRKKSTNFRNITYKRK